MSQDRDQRRVDELKKTVTGLQRRLEREEAGRRALEQRLFELQLFVEAVKEVQQGLGQSKDVGELLGVLLGRSIEAMGSEKGSLMLWDEAEGALQVAVVRGLSDPALERAINSGQRRCRRLRRGEGIAGRVFERGEAEVVEGVGLDGRFVGSRRHVRSLLCVPLMIGGTPIGVINITNKREGFFTLGDLELMTALGCQAAAAIERTRLVELATIDGLTGVLVRRRLMERLSDEVSRTRRFGRPMSLILLDIDHFKLINDTHGHLIGDAVLSQVAAVLKDNLRVDIDVVGRYGGDEFGLVLPETDAAGALVVAHRILSLVSEIEVPGRPVTLSMGVATCPSAGDTVEALMARADEALYQVKARGRDGVKVWELDQRPGRPVSCEIRGEPRGGQALDA